mgnify:CR=1 FL=1
MGSVVPQTAWLLAAVILFASIAAAWLMGAAHGAARVRHAEGSAIRERQSPSSTASGEATNRIVLPGDDADDEQEFTRVNAMRRRNDAFAAMPPLEELRAEAEAMRIADQVWQAPDIRERLAEFLKVADDDSLAVLRQHSSSVDVLRRLNDSAQAIAPHAFELPAQTVNPQVRTMR